MSVAHELVPISISIPISEQILLKAFVTTQGPKVVLQQTSPGINPKNTYIRLNPSELVLIIQSVQILFNLQTVRNQQTQ